MYNIGYGHYFYTYFKTYYTVIYTYKFRVYKKNKEKVVEWWV